MAEVAEAPPESTVDAAIKSQAQLFRYSTWVHVGPGAEQCPDVAENTHNCANPLHFHAWCRLPNQFQHREIREKALAARARRARQLRDTSSDSHAILDDDLETIMRGPDPMFSLVEEIVNQDWWKDYMEAVRELHEFEDERDERPWEGIEHDRKRLEELQGMDIADVPAEELGELERHLLAYTEAVQKAHEDIINPKRDALMARDIADVLEMVREQRITAEAQAEFMHIYSTWQWYAGTLRQPAGERCFASLEAMQAAAPEVIAALQETFEDLEQTFDEGPTKNS